MHDWIDFLRHRRLDRDAALAAMAQLEQGYLGLLNLHTGKVIAVSPEEQQWVEQGDASRLPAWQQEKIAELIELLHSQDFLLLPDQSAYDLLTWMQQFAADLSCEAYQQLCLQALQDPQPLRAFSRVLDQLHLQADWQAFRLQGFSEILQAWCAEHQLVWES